MKATNYLEAKREIIEVASNPDFKFEIIDDQLNIDIVCNISRKYKLTHSKHYLLIRCFMKIVKSKLKN